MDDTIQTGADDTPSTAGEQTSEPFSDVGAKGSSSSSYQSSTEDRNPVSWGIFTGVTAPALLVMVCCVLFFRGNQVLAEAGVVHAWGMWIVIHAVILLSALTIAAITTNVQTRGGGAYYSVSRVLGPEFGGPVGLGIFCAYTAAATVCLVGFVDVISVVIPSFAEYRLYLFFAALVVICLGVLFKSSWLPRANLLFLVLAVLGFAAVFATAGNRFSAERLAENWVKQYLPTETGDRGDFWGAFALWLPLASGLLAVLHGGYKVRKPQRDIPVGVFIFLAVSAAVSAAWIILVAGAFRRDVLAGSMSGLIKGQFHPVFGGVFVVGVLAVVVAGAAGNLLGAGAALQGIGRDGLLPVVRALGTPREEERGLRRSVLVAALGVLVIFVLIVWRLPENLQFDAVLRLTARFTLYALGILNAAAFFEAFVQTPGFRPRFPVFHWWTALIAALGCIGIAIIMRPVEALVAVLVLVGLTWYIKKRELDEAFGDAERGFLYKAARNNLVKLAYKGGPPSWRPTSLVFSGNPETRETLVSYAVWLSAGRGVVFLANILVGKLEQYAPHRDAVAQRLREFCAWKRIDAFPIVVVAQDLLQGVSSILQTVSLGPIRPNVALFGWTGDSGRIHVAAEQYRLAKAMDMSVIIVHGDERPFFYDRKRIDIWWRNERHGQLMLLLAHLLRQNWEWAHMNLRILCVVDSPARAQIMRTQVEKTLDDAHITSDLEIVVVSDESFSTVFHKYSGDADCIFLDFEVPSDADEGTWYESHTQLLREMPATILVNSEAPENIFQ